MDQRKRSLSRFVGKPKQGFTDYLNETVADWRSLVVHEAGNIEQLSILPGGHLMPNPTELLQTPRLAKLIAEMRKE